MVAVALSTAVKGSRTADPELTIVTLNDGRTRAVKGAVDHVVEELRLVHRDEYSLFVALLRFVRSGVLLTQTEAEMLHDCHPVFDDNAELIIPIIRCAVLGEKHFIIVRPY